MGNSACCQNKGGADDALPMVDARPIGQDSHNDEVLSEVPDARGGFSTTKPAFQGESSPQPPATQHVPEPQAAKLPDQGIAGEAKREPAHVEPPKAVPEAKEAKEEMAKVVVSEGFIVRVQRVEKKKLGVLVYNRNGEQFIRVRTVQEGGLIADWNAANAEKQLKPGCQILEVNGKRTPDDMRAELNDASNLQVLNIHVMPKLSS
mmetsp:Transcript_56506/g.132532  ORF Transcript_56506/g.132532 Transcript_56506/m.132532 type:complete len:205 (-) Transcript_56506:87-701(-)